MNYSLTLGFRTKNELESFLKTIDKADSTKEDLPGSSTASPETNGKPADVLKLRDVRGAFSSAESKDTDAAKGLLSKFDVGKVPELKEADWPEFVELCHAIEPKE